MNDNGHSHSLANIKPCVMKSAHKNMKFFITENDYLEMSNLH